MRTTVLPTVKLVALAALLATTVVMGANVPSAGAGCAAATQTISGTLAGEDGRYVNAMIGIALFDAAGGEIGADGCPRADGVYGALVMVNPSLTGEGADAGAGLTQTWSAAVPSNAVRAYVEVYPRAGPGGVPSPDDTIRYGKSMRHDIPISGGVEIELPLNCGIVHNGVAGSNGSIVGTTYLNGAPVEADRVWAFSLRRNFEPGIVGWSIATTSADGSFRLDNLESGQHYQVMSWVGGVLQRTFWVPLNDCATVPIDITYPVQSELVVEGATFFVSNSFAPGPAEVVTVFGFPGNEPLVGDWNGDSFDDIAVRDGKLFNFRLGTSAGYPTSSVSFGKATDEVFVGDWNDDFVATLAVRRGNVFYLKDSVSGGAADHVLAFGRAGDEVFVGDWDGDGVDTFAVRRGNVFHLRNDRLSGPATTVFGYGRSGDQVLVGDWDGDGRDSFAVRRGNTFFLRNDTLSGPATTVFAFGKSTDTVLVGDWNGDRIDTFAVHR